MNDNQDVN